MLMIITALGVLLSTKSHWSTVNRASAFLTACLFLFVLRYKHLETVAITRNTEHAAEAGLEAAQHAALAATALAAHHLPAHNTFWSRRSRNRLWTRT